MQAETVMRLVAGALQDLEPGTVPRWSWESASDGVSLLDFLNNAVRAVAMQRPDAFLVTEPILLEPGMRQLLPGRKHRASRQAATLVNVIRNLCNGEKPGAAIHHADVSVLLAWADPQKTAREVETFAYDRIGNPAVYYVYPAVPENYDVWVEASYSAKPCEITSSEQCIGIDDAYAPALQHHMLAAILSGDNESANGAKAAYHMQMYSSVLGMKMQIDSAWKNTKIG